MNQERPDLVFKNNLRRTAKISQLQSFTNDKQDTLSEGKESLMGVKKSKKWIFGILIVSTLAVLSFLGTRFISDNDRDSKDTFYCDMPQLIATVKARGDGYKTVKLSLSLKVQGSKSLKYINKNLPILQSSFSLLLTSLRTADFESAGFGQKLQNELQKRVDHLFPGMVKATLIRELLLE